MSMNNNYGSKKAPPIDGDAVERLNAMIDWKSFIPVLDAVIQRNSGYKGGRPPYGNIVMFKILALKWLCNLSYDRTECLINDSAACRKFLGSELMPDAKTIWLFKDTVIGSGAALMLAEMLTKAWEERRADIGGFTPQSGFLDSLSGKRAK